MSFAMTLPTAIGTLILVADEQGLARIVLPPDADRFKAIDRVTAADHPLLDAAAGQIIAYLRGRLTNFDLPLSLTGTRFRQRVWAIMRTIPYGETRTYGEIARELGNDGLARAVGGAANANPVPLVIPCHRVVGAHGRLTGFAGGLTMKKYLLELERS
ncbi:methylated-DNA--protein-cysteine methyltransferase [bacterium BMS3Bbin14]|nr:methylated-DNA--protein-cysteine methyltransferase [bacterium BMS3Bbin14]HDK44241.1 methylated-DNA--[protein]-cysteine S-methyltransferase [Desulfobacteraceae bacterium]HDL98183.1 methylated-DNA--[protein]-cysteine S-methyltransferase [Desulfobacteraceae bacterium]HDO30254.1 methylated-DNA--[protein]-cysteine S-methyltransferase [Desulfobacteraceae bacterium]